MQDILSCVYRIWTILKKGMVCYHPKAYAILFCEVNTIGNIRRSIMIFCLLAALWVVPMKTEAADMDPKAGTVNVSGGWLNIRSAPSATSSKLGALQKGSYITLISQTGAWWKVEYEQGRFGYCHGDYIRVVSSDAAKVAVSNGSLNVRSGPGTGNSKIGSLYKGEVVVKLSSSSGWSKILYRGSQVGYVSSRYLSSGYAPITHNVPSLKQTDQRWADKTIGTSGKTFSQIGCATTAIAMVESFRRGHTVYPDIMSKELRYTPSGSVYWPADYVAVTDNSSQYQDIYGLLQQGKVILFGSRNQHGTQHWVVITGYTGGDRLTPEGFLIHDPGTYSRTNLKQFLDVYPNFYKYFYYR